MINFAREPISVDFCMIVSFLFICYISWKYHEINTFACEQLLSFNEYEDSFS